jgi:hypothetical protein
MNFPYHLAGPSYVEVHPCDKFFSHDRSTFFSVLGSPFTFHECKGHSEAVAWSHMDLHKLSNSECFPIVWKKKNRLLVDPDLQKKGLCFKFNVRNTPECAYHTSRRPR